MCVLTKLVSTPLVSPNYYHFVYNDDTWEYISQGLSLLDLRIEGGRPPLLALLYGILFKAGLDKYLGLLNQMISLFASVPVYIIARKLYNRTTACISVLFLLASGYYATFSFFLGADILCSSLIACSLACLLLNTRLTNVLAWIFITLSFYAHNLPPIAISFPLVLLLVQGKHFYRRKSNHIGIGIAIVLFIIYFLFFINYDSLQYRNLRHLGYKGISDLTGYIINILFVLGATGGILCIFGILASLHKHDVSKKSIAVLFAWMLPFVCFFGLFYAWLSCRFLIYFLFPAIIITAHGVASLLKFLPAYVVTLLIIVTALYMNSASIPSLTGVSSSTMVLYPGITLTENLTLKREETHLAHWYYLATDKESIRLQVLASIFPHDVERLADILNKHVNKDHYYSIVPFNFRARSRLYTRLQVLSERKAMPISYSNLNDPRRAVIVLLNLPPSDEEIQEGGPEYTILNYPLVPEQAVSGKIVRDYLSRFNHYAYHSQFGIFRVYIRRQ